MLDEGNSRIQVIQIDTNASPICLINVYMPSDNKEMGCEYKDMISQLTEVIEKYRNAHEIGSISIISTFFNMFLNDEIM
jgi:hypothetical protein